MASDWHRRIASLWSSAEETEPEHLLRQMRSLYEERGSLDPEALFEWASVHDFLGMEHEAVPLYRDALAQGIAEPKRSQTIIQLASSLRNVGDPHAAVELIQGHSVDEALQGAAQAFLALALHDTGRPDAALRAALLALAGTLPQY